MHTVLDKELETHQTTAWGLCLQLFWRDQTLRSVMTHQSSGHYPGSTLHQLEEDHLQQDKQLIFFLLLQIIFLAWELLAMVIMLLFCIMESVRRAYIRYVWFACKDVAAEWQLIPKKWLYLCVWVKDCCLSKVSTF